MARQTSKRTVRRARALRREMSLPEVLLWRLLKHSDVKLRKQHPCGRFVVDFYCPPAKLVIEIDGIAHEAGERPERDEARTRWLEARGYELCRIPASEVLKDVESMAESIVSRCRGRSAKAPPSPPADAAGATSPMTASRPQGGFRP
jgi:very-short-patch-repair endonuclease